MIELAILAAVLINLIWNRVDNWVVGQDLDRIEKKLNELNK